MRVLAAHVHENAFEPRRAGLAAAGLTIGCSLLFAPSG